MINFIFFMLSVILTICGVVLNIHWTFKTVLIVLGIISGIILIILNLRKRGVGEMSFNVITFILEILFDGV